MYHQIFEQNSKKERFVVLVIFTLAYLHEYFTLFASSGFCCCFFFFEITLNCLFSIPLSTVGELERANAQRWLMPDAQWLMSNDWWPMPVAQWLMSNDWWRMPDAQWLVSNDWWPMPNAQWLVSNDWSYTIKTTRKTLLSGSPMSGWGSDKCPMFGI